MRVDEEDAMNRLTLWAALAAVIAAPANAAYPDKPVRVIVPTPAGGTPDVVARMVTPGLAAALGQQMVVDNRGGAGGNLGMEAAARAAPDGYTVVMGLTAQLAVNPALFPKIPYDPIRDFEPIMLFANGGYLLVSHPSLPAKTVNEVIAIARKQPGQLLYASSGNGSGGHLASELFNVMAGVRITHVPYKGGAQAMVDTVAGQTQLLFTPPISSAGHVASGRLRAIAVSTTKRISSMPNLPTIAESGVPGYEMGQWYGLLAPAGTPAAVIERVNAEAGKALKHPDLRTRFQAEGADPAHGSPAEFGAYFKAEIAKWSEVVRKAGIAPH